MQLEEGSLSCCKSTCWLQGWGESNGGIGLGEGSGVVGDGDWGIGDSDLISDCVE